METRRAPLWMLPNLLSLDAPVVALVWMWMLAHALRVDYLQPAAWWVLSLSIWCIYVGDRLLDAWRNPSLREHSPRHRFHWKWRFPLAALILVAGGVSIWQAMYALPRGMFSVGLVLSFFCVLYFLLAATAGKGVPFLKNFVAGMVFAMGVGIPVVVSDASMLAKDLGDVTYAYQHNTIVDAAWNLAAMILSALRYIFLGSKEVLIFGLLCVMNITAIDLWEKAEKAADENTASQYESTLTLGLIILAGGTLVFAAFRADDFSKPYYYALMSAAALLQLLNHYRTRFSMRSLRVLADVAMILPLPIVLVSH
ncbi:MAG: hypothetical protein ACPG32_06650 [Akkermansiaceae bacterium]